MGILACGKRSCNVPLPDVDHSRDFAGPELVIIGLRNDANQVRHFRAEAFISSGRNITSPCILPKAEPNAYACWVSFEPTEPSIVKVPILAVAVGSSGLLIGSHLL